ncbi:hypothetical protein ATO2_01740 [Roseovarius sp. 22II1-1F6A]|nr:hypothetical protein ATO2_01740 [Roseovarius sp. 22II1-1F6A]
MRQALMIYAVGMAGFQMVYLGLGFEPARNLGLGLVVLLAVLISGVFGWLWLMRTTPLALGLAFSWAGAACLLGWWWLREVLGTPGWMAGNAVVFAFLTTYLTGAVLHLVVVQQSFALRRVAAWAPVALAAVISLILLAWQGGV